MNKSINYEDAKYYHGHHSTAQAFMKVPMSMEHLKPSYTHYQSDYDENAVTLQFFIT